MKRLRLILIVALALFALMSCDDNNPPADGFSVGTLYQEFVNGIPTTPPFPDPGISFNATFVFGNPTVGHLNTCSGTTNISAVFPCPDRKAPGAWALNETSGRCAGMGTSIDAVPGQVAGAVCKIFHIQTLFVTPNFANPLVVQTFHITGEGLSSTYGMPIVQIVNPIDSTVLVSTTASAIDGGGTWVDATPNLTSLYTGSYAIAAYNISSNQSLELVGATELYLYGHCDPVPQQECLARGGIYYWDSETCTCQADPCLQKPWLCE